VKSTLKSASTAEIRSQLYVALDAAFITQPQFDRIYQLADDAGNLMGGFMRYLRTAPYRGRKF
jgi:hypothetical protein